MDRTTFDTQINALLQDAAVLIPKVNRDEDLPVSFDWFRWEMDLWNLGEQIRQLLLLHSKALTIDQARDVLNICLTRAAGKGRQSFVLLLGKTKYSPMAESLSSLLSDPDVCGQVINTLYKMKAPGYSDQIRPFLSHKQAWIRKEAQRYLQKYT